MEVRKKIFLCANFFFYRNKPTQQNSCYTKKFFFFFFFFVIWFHAPSLVCSTDRGYIQKIRLQTYSSQWGLTVFRLYRRRFISQSIQEKYLSTKKTFLHRRARCFMTQAAQLTTSINSHVVVKRECRTCRIAGVRMWKLRSHQG